MAQKQKPAKTFKLGRTKAAIWANQSEGRDVWFNVTVVRLYKDGDQWKDTSAFRRDDLPMVRMVVDMAYAWIWEQEVPANSDEAIA
jgi:hypothetical protein